MKLFNFKKPKKGTIDADFVTQNAEDMTEDDIKKVVDSASKIQSKMQANGRFNKFIEDGKVMLSLIKDYWKKDYTEIPWYAMTAIVFSLLYVLNPLDLAPDYIPFLGYMDDVTVFSFALTLVNKDLNAYKNWKKPKEELD
tara:strand:+ start:49518 stop:49937 length:420 start_codon:yes stop_codon:yes gene_type:complete